MLPVSTQSWVLTTGTRESGARIRLRPLGRTSRVAVVGGNCMTWGLERLATESIPVG